MILSLTDGEADALSLTGRTPEPVERFVVDLFTGKGTAVVTNVPGPTRPVYLAGNAVRAVMVWAPTSGHIGIELGALSGRRPVRPSARRAVPGR